MEWVQNKTPSRSKTIIYLKCLQYSCSNLSWGKQACPVLPASTWPPQISHWHLTNSSVVVPLLNSPAIAGALSTLIFSSAAKNRGGSPGLSCGETERSLLEHFRSRWLRLADHESPSCAPNTPSAGLSYKPRGKPATEGSVSSRGWRGLGWEQETKLHLHSLPLCCLNK